MPNTMLDNAIISIDSTGFFDYALPFMITFAVIYGILQKTKLFSRDNKNIDAIFSLCVSLIILPFVSNLDYISFAAKLVLVIFALFGLALIQGLLGYKFENTKRYSFFTALALILIIVFSEFLGINSLRNFISNYEITYALLILLVFGLIIWIISSSSKKVQETLQKKVEKTIGKPSVLTEAESIKKLND